jgi:hypothetical protein
MISFIIVGLLFCLAVLMFVREIQAAPITTLSEYALTKYGLPASPEIERLIKERETFFHRQAILKARLQHKKGNILWSFVPAWWVVA